MKRLATFVVPAVLGILLAALVGPTAAAAAEPFARACPAEALEEGAEAKLNHNPAAKHSIVPGGANSRFTLRELEGGPVVLSPNAGNIEDPCVVVFFPPEIREHIAEEEREEAKAAKRGYDRSAGG